MIGSRIDNLLCKNPCDLGSKSDHAEQSRMLATGREGRMPGKASISSLCPNMDM